MPVFAAPFIWDDTPLLELPLVRQLAPLHDYFAGSFWQHTEMGVVHNYYRPLTVLSLALDRVAYGDNPSGFHITNLLFHLAATAVLFALLRRDGASGYVAALGSALWALAPRLTEAAAWVSGRTDVLAGFFVLSALLAQRSGSRLARFASPLLLLLGLFCKETALAGVLAVLVAEWQVTFGLRARLRGVTPTLAMFVAYVALRLHAVGVTANLIHVSPSKRVLAVIEALGRYLWMLLVPWLPDVQIGNLERRNLPFVLLGVLCLCLLVVWFWRNHTRFEAVKQSYLALTGGALGLALFAIPFSISAVAADRFLYLPLAGITLLAVPWLAARTARWPAAPLVALTLIASLAAATFARVGTWADEVEFWSSTLHQHPEEPSMASIGLASVYSREGLFPQALAVLRRASRPGMDIRELALRNTGTTLLRSGEYESGHRVFSQLVAEHPTDAVYAVDLALSEIDLNHFADARSELERALQIVPSAASARSLLARLYTLRRDRQELDAWPASMPALARARLEVTLGLKNEAMHSFELALADPNVTQSAAEEATRFALLAGDASRRAKFFERYAALVRGRTDPELQLAFDTHLGTVAKLRAAWPTLLLAL
jgi:Flp pilus assembly protein TadD